MRSIVIIDIGWGWGGGCYLEMMKFNVCMILGEIYFVFIILRILKFDIFRFFYYYFRNLNCLV